MNALTNQVNNQQLNGNRALHFWDSLLEMYAITCDFCHHLGHKMLDCPLKKSADRLASAMGIRVEWGNVKYEAYYQAYLNAHPLLL
jgi:hypothetical protein